MNEQVLTLPRRGRVFNEQRVVKVRQRDPEVWTTDPLVKVVKKTASNFQHITNYWLKCYQENLDNLRGNIHLKIGKQRI